MVKTLEYLFEFIDDLPVGIARADTTGKLPNHFNKYFLQMTGWDASDVDTLEKWFIKAYPDEAYRAHVLKIWDNMAQEAESQNKPHSKPETFKVTCKDGSFKWCKIRYYRKKGFIYGIFTDISSQKEAEENLKKLNRDLEKKAAMGEFVSVIAHQLKQPLTAISTTMNLISDDYKFDELTEEQLADYDKSIRQSIDFMSSSIDDLRNFFNPSKISSHFSINQAIEKALSIVSTNIRSCGGIDIKTDFYKDATINGFENEFQQVILNILTNAKEALKERKPENAFIKITTTYDKNHAMTIIEDNAGGVSEEHKSKIFDLYYTTKGKEGTGIGLNLSKMIIEQSFGGTIEVSNSGEGAVFTIKLPLADKKATL